jgi:hypothetical protein
MNDFSRVFVSLSRRRTSAAQSFASILAVECKIGRRASSLDTSRVVTHSAPGTSSESESMPYIVHDATRVERSSRAAEWGARARTRPEGRGTREDETTTPNF